MTDKTIDWELVEKEYRAGILSNVQISKQCGLSESAIRKQANKFGWVKDLTAKIQAKADEKVRAEAVRGASSSASLGPVTEQQVIEANADVQVGVRIGHRKDIARSRSLFGKLLDELELTTDNRALFEQLGELMDESGEDASGRYKQDKRAELYAKVISMPIRVDSSKKLVEMLEKTVRLEREAYGIDKEEDSDHRVDKALKAFAEFRKANG